MSRTDVPGPFRALTERWEQEAQDYEHLEALVRGDRLLRRAVNDLERAWREHHHAMLTVQQAARETGYSEEALRDLVRRGAVPDNRPEGSYGNILIPRWSLPKKPGHFEDGGGRS